MESWVLGFLEECIEYIWERLQDAELRGALSPVSSAAALLLNALQCCDSSPLSLATLSLLACEHPVALPFTCTPHVSLLQHLCANCPPLKNNWWPVSHSLLKLSDQSIVSIKTSSHVFIWMYLWKCLSFLTRNKQVNTVLSLLRFNFHFAVLFYI